MAGSSSTCIEPEKLKYEVDAQIEALKVNFCGSLLKKGTQDLIIYLARISLEPIAKLFRFLAILSGHGAKFNNILS